MNVYYEEEFLKGSDITECFKEVFTLKSPQESDFFICTSIDNKILQAKNNLKNFILKAKELNKKIIFLGQGDIEEGYLPESIGYNFKNNLFKTKKFKNEFSLTSLSEERVPDKPFIPYVGRCSVGFCGASDRFNREKYLNDLKNSDIETSFIIKNGPKWGTSSYEECVNEQITKQIQEDSVSAFYKNISETLFTLCIRGWGNYSYRFCQTICMGRIPILIDTDCVLPFEEIFNYNNFIVRITPDQNIVNAVTEFYKSKNNNLVDIQQQLFSFGNEYLTPVGFMKNLHKLIEHYERNN
jgi:hypothetical protein